MKRNLSNKSLFTRIVRKTGKIILRIIIVYLLLMLLIIGLIQLPPVQNFIKDKALSGLTERLNTRIEVGNINLNLRGNLSITNVFIADDRNDTLLTAKKILVGIKPAALLRKEIKVSLVSLSGSKFNYTVRDTSGSTNLDFIARAFAGEDEENDTTAKESEWRIGLQKIALDDIKLKLSQIPDSSLTNLHIGNLLLNFSKADISEMQFNADLIYLGNTQISLTTYKRTPSVEEKAPENTDDSESQQKITFSIKEISLNRITLVNIDSLTGGKGTVFIGEAGIFPENIDLANNSLRIDRIQITKGYIMFKKGKDIKSPEEQEDAASASWSVLLRQGNISLDSISFEQSGPGPLNIKLSNAFLDFNGKYNSSSDWEGSIKKLVIKDEKTGQNLSLSLNSSFLNNELFVKDLDLQAGSSLIGLSNLKYTTDQRNAMIPYFQLDTFHASIRIADLRPYLPDSLAAELSDITALNSYFSSKGSYLHGRGNIFTNAGKLSYTTSLLQSVPPNETKYELALNIPGLNVGKFLNDTAIGEMTGHITLKGTGIDPDTLVAEIKVAIDSVTFQKMKYRNIRLDGTLDHGDISAVLTSSDTNANFRFDLQGTFRNKLPNFNLQASINQLDLGAMGLIRDTLAFSGKLNGSFQKQNNNHVVIRTVAPNLTFVAPRQKISTNFNFFYNVKDSDVHAQLNSNLGNLDYRGNLRLEQISQVLSNNLRKHLKEITEDSLEQDYGDKHFRFTMDLNDLSLLNKLLPLQIHEKGSITAELNNNKLTANAEFGRISMQETAFDTVKLGVVSDDSLMDFKFFIHNLHNGNTSIRAFEMKGNYSQSNLYARLKFSNSEELPWFDIGFNSFIKDKKIRVGLHDSLMINRQYWTIDTSNSLVYDNRQVSFRKFEFYNGNKEFSITNNRQNAEKIQVRFRNLDLSFISEILRGDTTTISGKLNGDVSLLNLLKDTSLVFEVGILVSEIKTAQYPMGDLKLNVSNVSNPDVIGINLDMGKKDMSLSVQGNYGLKEGIPTRINLSTRNFNLAGLAPLLETVISEPSGAINASIDVTGSAKQPRIDGNLEFLKTAFRINATQARYNIDEQKILFNGDRINLQSFTIRDSTNHTMVISGDVALTDLENISYQIKINSDNFLVYNVTPYQLIEKESKIFLSSTIDITGSPASTNVNATLAIDEGSRLYYQMSGRAGNFSEKGIVRFVNEGAPAAPPQESLTQELNIVANISIAEGTSVTIITDPAKEDGLKDATLKGTLTLTQRPFQSPRLVGKTDISGGTYAITLPGLHREFDIAPNSTANWTGDMANPDIELKAVYTVQTSPVPILSEDLRFSSSGRDANQYSDNLPFLVNITIKGTLAKPDLSFSITLPEDQEGVYGGIVTSKLQQINADESEVNKQAVSLLLFGTFGIPDLADLTAGNSERTNALISKALNQFSAQEIRFVDLNFNLQSYDNSGGSSDQNVRTELKTNASKKFFDERLDAQVGTTIVLQGDEEEQNSSWINNISPEFDLRYIMNKPKTISVRAFRQEEYRGLIEGKVINTGAGIMFQKDYNTLKQLFRREGRK